MRGLSPFILLALAATSYVACGEDPVGGKSNSLDGDAGPDRVLPQSDAARDVARSEDRSEPPDAQSDTSGDAPLDTTSEGDGGRCPSGYEVCGETCRNTAACSPTCAGGSYCAGGRCVCLFGQTMCNGTCVSTETVLDCGACSKLCDPGTQECRAGTCVCSAPLVDCGGSCVDRTTNPMHCGACGRRCATGEPCSNGYCGVNPFDLNSDPDHCGAVGNRCASRNCEAGMCKPCLGTICSDRCVNTSSDAQNCGACGRVCASKACNAGTCASCAVAECAGQCVDSAVDPLNCGACDNRCYHGAKCNAGVCVSPPVFTLSTANGYYMPGGSPFPLLAIWASDVKGAQLLRPQSKDDIAGGYSGAVRVAGSPTDDLTVWISSYGDAFDGSRFVTSGIVEAADSHALITCDGRLLIDLTPVTGVSDARSIAYAPRMNNGTLEFSYYVHTATGQLFEVSPIDYAAKPLASGVKNLNRHSDYATWVDASDVMRPVGTDAPRQMLAGTRFGVMTGNGYCIVELANRVICGQFNPPESAAIELPSGVVPRITQIAGGRNSSLFLTNYALDGFDVAVMTDSGEVYAWEVGVLHDIARPHPERFNVTPAKRVRGP